MPVGMGVPQWKDLPNYGLVLNPHLYPDMVTSVILRLGIALLPAHRRWVWRWLEWPPGASFSACSRLGGR